MYVINDDNSIYVTRGDMVLFSVSADQNGSAYTFQPGQIVRIKVYEKKNAENVVLQKDFPVTEETAALPILLDKQDTKIGEVISKPVDYWYEVELNPDDPYPQTIVGYDEDGAKVFKLFPEGADIESYEPEITPEDIPIVDAELDPTSTRPIQNQAVAREAIRLNEEYKSQQKATAAALKQVNELSVTVAEINSKMVVESEEHPGCYYRMVDDKVEWINPPMELGAIYRTAERYGTKPVYVQRFSFGHIPALTSPAAMHPFPLNAEIISITGVHIGLSKMNHQPLPTFHTDGTLCLNLMMTRVKHYANPEENPTAHIFLDSHGDPSALSLWPSKDIPYKEDGERVEAIVKYYYTD